MFALTGKNRGMVDGSIFGGVFGRVFVSSRPVRRAIRFATALARGRVSIPRYAGPLGASVFFCATLGTGMVLGGHTHATSEAVSSALGFAVNTVNVTGNAQTSDIDVLQQLHLDGDTSLLTMNAHAARDDLRALPWVADAQVRKVYPNSIDVALSERKAFAIWQHGQDLSLIEASGSVIGPYKPGTFSSLPLYVGLGAETEGARFVAIFSDYPALQKRVRAVVRVADRRWNLYFDNGVTVKLPAKGVAQALENLTVMERDRKILTRDIVAVDLRLSDRITVQLTPEAAKRRGEAIEERDKALKAAEKRA